MYVNENLKYTPLYVNENEGNNELDSAQNTSPSEHWKDMGHSNLILVHWTLASVDDFVSKSLENML